MSERSSRRVAKRVRSGFRTGALGIAVALLASACVAPPPPPGPPTVPYRTPLARLFADGFEGYQPPSGKSIRQAPDTQSMLLPGARYRTTFNALVGVLAQDALIVFASYDSGVVAAFNQPPATKGPKGKDTPAIYLVSGVPQLYYVERQSAGVAIHAAWQLELYRRLDQPEAWAIGVTPRTQHLLSEALFTVIEREVKAARLAERFM